LIPAMGSMTTARRGCPVMRDFRAFGNVLSKM
jgi:hypothetical protein